MRFLWIFLFFLSACKRHETSAFHGEKASWRQIKGREGEQAIYRVKTPVDWRQKDPSKTEALVDTTQAICEFYIEEEGRGVRLTIHNFPTETLEERVPPRLQIQRWQSQFEELDPHLTVIEPCSHGGFSGLSFEGQEAGDDQAAKTLGWSMRLATPYYRHLSGTNDKLDRQKRADYTIKAVGPSDLVNKHRQRIIRFAASFELIEELPFPL